MQNIVTEIPDLAVDATDPTAEITAALRRVSPRFNRPPLPLRSVLIYGSVLALWIGVTIGAWFASGIAAWSAGLLYIFYDTWLLVYVARKTLFILQVRAAAAGPLSPAGAAQTGAAQTGSAQAGGRDPSLGVIIAAYNEAPALPATLDALLSQLASDDIALIVDDGSEDGTGDMLAARYGLQWPEYTGVGRSSRYPALRVWRGRHGGKACALNAGLAQLRTDVLVTVDADTRLAPGALASLRRAFAHDAAMVAGCGVIRPVCAPGPLSGIFEWFQTYEYIRAFCSRIAWMRADALLLVSGAFAAFRRDALLVVGGFDPACLVEDYELIHRLHRYSLDRGLGWRVRVLSEPRAITDAPGTLPSFLRQRRRWFAGFLQTQYWNSDMTGNRRYGTVGRWMLPIKAIDTMQPIYGLTAFVLLIDFAVQGRLRILLPVLAVILSKIVIDIGFHLWWVKLYGHWTGQRTSRSGFGLALLAALAEPFSFQLMRHVGAAWGWCSFITGRHNWGVTPSLAIEEASSE